MSPKPVRTRRTNVRLNGYDHDHVGGSESSQHVSSQQAGGGRVDQGQFGATPQTPLSAATVSAAGPSRPPSTGPAPVTPPSPGLDTRTRPVLPSDLPALAESDHSDDESDDDDSDVSWLPPSNTGVGGGVRAGFQARGGGRGGDGGDRGGGDDRGGGEGNGDGAANAEAGLALTPARRPAPMGPPGSASPPRPTGPAFFPQQPVQLVLHEPPLSPVHAVGDVQQQPVGGAGLVVAPVVAPVLQEEVIQLAGLQAARLAGREAAWELQQNAVQGDQGAEGGGGDQAVAIQGERGSLVDRLVPVVPPPVNRELSEDGLGWDLIDRVGGWRSNLCKFPVMEQVPYQHRVVWGWAFSEVLRRIQNSDEGRELDRGLMWLAFLPQALLCQALLNSSSKLCIELLRTYWSCFAYFVTGRLYQQGSMSFIVQIVLKHEKIHAGMDTIISDKKPYIE